MPRRVVELFQHDLLLVRVDDKLFDILREHRQPLVFLGVGQSSGELDILRVDDKSAARILLLNSSSLAACPASGPRLESLRLVEALVLLRILGETVHESRTQHFIFVRLDLGPGVVKDLLGAQAALRGA